MTTADLRLRWDVVTNTGSGFAKPLDLRLGDLTLGPSVDKQRFLDEAWAEIEARLGYRYEVPLSEDLPHHTQTVLKRIHAYLASGNLLLEQGVGSESLQSFGVWLVDKAQKDLMLILDGKLDVDGLVEIPVQRTGISNAPTILISDDISPFDVFDQFAFGRPGATPWHTGPRYTPPEVEADESPLHDPFA